MPPLKVAVAHESSKVPARIIAGDIADLGMLGRRWAYKLA